MSSSLSTSAFISNPTTPAYADDADWITAYLSIHTMSEPSGRYGYLLWIAIAFIFLMFALLHWAGSKGGFIGASWSKWSIRRRTWRKKHRLAMARRKNQPHRQPSSLPSNAQLLCLFALLLATAVLSVAGPDYISPSDKLWPFHRRALETTDIVTREVTYDPTAFQPRYTIFKSWWTAGGRTGLVAFALLPLCTLFALKAPPFAIFAVPFMIQLHFDKLAYLHRWSGRLIWLISTAHVATWTIQLVRDRRESTGNMALFYAWQEPKFIYGWVSFGLLTLIIAFSVLPFRRGYYEAFYFLHVLLIPLFLVTAAFHHPPVWWWCWAALGLWFGERLWRATWWLHTNGYFGGMFPRQSSHQSVAPVRSHGSKRESWEMNSTYKSNPDEQALNSPTSLFPGPQRPNSPPYQTIYKSPLSPAEAPRSPYPGKRHSAMSSLYSHSTSFNRTPLSPTGPYIPPAGYAHAELLPGRTVRLRFISPGFLSWAPGQHFLINIPSVSRFTSHPFTVASVCDERGPDAGRIMVILIRAKNGWTKDLWDAIVELVSRGQKYPHNECPTRGAEMPARGALMRMYVDGPFGSSIRARWGSHSTVLIVAGGSGVSFGLSILQYMCMCLSGRDGCYLGGRPGGWGRKGFVTSRVRFVWLVREFCHIQWGATILRRCMALVPSPGLQIDIFVTNVKPSPHSNRNSYMSHILSPTPSPSQSRFPSDITNDYLVPPTPGFAHHGRQSPVSSESGEDSVEPYVDLSYYPSDLDGREYRREDRELGDFEPDCEDHILDLTNFDGDNDIVLPGEEALSRTVRKQGKIRRANTRKAAAKTLVAKQTFSDGHTTEPESRQTRDGRSSSHIPRQLSETTFPTDMLLPYTSPISSRTGKRLSTGVEINLSDPVASYSDSSHLQSPPPTPHTSQYGHSEAHLNWESTSDATIVREMMPRSDTSAEEVRLEIDDQEMHDVNVVSEHAWPGKPKLDQMVSDEVDNSKGSTIVACCGPVSLNAMVRKIIAAKIDPARIRRGDMRGMIALVSEEFEY